MCKVFLAKFLIYLSLGESSFSLSRDISRMAVFGTLSDSRKNSRKENDGWDLLFSEEWKNESLGYSHLSQSIYVSFLLVGLGYITLTIDNTKQTLVKTILKQIGQFGFTYNVINEKASDQLNWAINFL